MGSLRKVSLVGYLSVQKCCSHESRRLSSDIADWNGHRRRDGRSAKEKVVRIGNLVLNYRVAKEGVERVKNEEIRDVKKRQFDILCPRAEPIQPQDCQSDYPHHLHNGLGECIVAQHIPRCHLNFGKKRAP